MPAARQRIGRHLARDQQRPVLAHHHARRVARLGIRRELARDRREQIGGRDDAFEMPIFVMDQPHRHFGRRSAVSASIAST
jgi:hypothetical protein